ncbi:hypothetical protein EDB87DRAFT_1626066 [Lactarius vividus]|nr:hypothetical protein EDB87DRAFT_1626066 [Lactarius vividus]
MKRMILMAAMIHLPSHRNVLIATCISDFACTVEGANKTGTTDCVGPWPCYHQLFSIRLPLVQTNEAPWWANSHGLGIKKANYWFAYSTGSRDKPSRLVRINELNDRKILTDSLAETLRGASKLKDELGTDLLRGQG